MTRRKKRRWRGTWRDARKDQRAASTIATTALGLALVVLFIWVLRLGTAPLQPAVALNSRLPPCPVGGTPINFAHELVTLAGPIFFCSEHCAEKYEAYPSKYRENLRKQQDVLADLPRVQVTCPVSDDAVDAVVSIEREGNPVFFCCGECVPKFQADPDAYRGDLAASYTYQTKCPVGGKPITPEVSLTMPEGQSVYFCSEACQANFQRNPANYVRKLAEQGLKIHL